MNKKKWLSLGVVATGLLLIPRRSSRQNSIHPQPKNDNSENEQTENSAASHNDPKNSNSKKVQ
ncbi:hypothetical protein [Psychrobacter sp. CAL346-MNA-CIBAN-0220]|uniref:hypothetical protein n=1 Tax=Psychrobacter sp. CAL346-MNA-CIBAN-0220 TaxID=3140457 RepID=UPI00331BAB60